MFEDHRYWREKLSTSVSSVDFANTEYTTAEKRFGIRARDQVFVSGRKRIEGAINFKYFFCGAVFSGAHPPKHR
jgi:hypothetical protein